MTIKRLKSPDKIVFYIYKIMVNLEPRSGIAHLFGREVATFRETKCLLFYVYLFLDRYKQQTWGDNAS